jgi:hypothetical protein
MALLTQNLFLASTLFISPSQPARISQTSSQVWFSDPQSVEARPLERGLILKALKSRARLQATGLDASKNTWTSIQIVSDANYKALKKCSDRSLTWDSSLKIPTAFSSSQPLLDSLKYFQACGFDELAWDPQSPQWNEFQKLFLEAESRAEWQGLRLLSKEWDHGTRRIQIEKLPHNTFRLRKILGPLSPFAQIEEVSAPRPGNTLIFEVTLFEFSRQAASKLGLTWPEQFRILPLEGNPFEDSLKNLQLGLDFGESYGVGRVLAKPQIRVKAGQVSKFHSGGEIPIQILTENVKKTEWKDYGLLLEIGVPANTATGSREVSVDFKIELSEPDFSMGAESSPGMSVRRLQSQFDLRIRETTVLSTMIQTHSGARRSGLAGLGRVPVLRNLFSSKGQLNHESELWFAIRPVWDEILWQEDLPRKVQNDLKDI